MCFHGRLGPELQEIVGKYSQHQEIDGGERCNEPAGNGKLTLQCHRYDVSHEMSKFKGDLGGVPDLGEVPDPRGRKRLGLNDAGIFQWPFKCGQGW